MTWLLAKSLAKGAWKFLRAIPWQAWLFLAFVAAAWWYGEQRYAAGEADVRKEWAEAIARGKKRHNDLVAQRDAATKQVNSVTNWDAQNATVETRTETAAAVERVKYEVRTIKVPANCPTGLPDSVRNEGRAAVERARATGGTLRAGGDP